jgi:antitoxin PrlF
MLSNSPYIFTGGKSDITTASMQIGKITSKGQTTIPASIRKAAKLEEGDRVLFEVKEYYVILRKIKLPADDYLKNISPTLNEWLSPEDEEAWSEL